MFRGKVAGRVAPLALIAALACSSDTTSPGGNNNNAGSISLNLSAAALSIVQDANNMVTATVGRSGSFNGAIAIAVEGLPNNITAAASPASIAAGATTSTITFAAAAGAAAGNTTVTIRASGSGVSDQTRTMALTVTAATQGGFTIALAPGTLSIQQNAQNTSTATLTRTGGFTGNVSFNATGAPNGMTVSFNPTSTTANATTITVAVGGSVAANNYPVVIRASANGVADQTATLNVAVTAVGGGGGNTTFRFCPPTTAVFAAFQDGNGPWTALTITNNTVTFNVASGRGGIAYVLNPSPNVFTTVFTYGTQAELNAGGSNCPALPPMKSVNGSIANVGPTEVAYVGLAGASNVVSPSAPNFTLQNVADRTSDLMATRVATVVAGANVTQTANRAILRRNINPAANSTLPVLDFNAAEAFNPVMRTLTANNLGNDGLTVFQSFLTANGGASLLYSEIQLVAGATRQIPTIAGTQTGDIHLLTMLAASGPPPYPTSRSVLAYYTASADKSFTFGPPIGPVTVTAAATAPTVRLRTQYTVQPEYNRAITANYPQTVGGITRVIVLNFTSGYLTASTTLDHTQPDLSGLTGWNNLWGLVQGAAIQWSLTALTFTGTGQPLDGVVTTVATRIGTITP